MGRAEGDQWIGEDGCNKCRCLKSGTTPCTRLACQNFHLQNLLVAREFADGTAVPQQCSGEGRRSCRQVDINLPFLEEFKSSVNPSGVDRVNLLQGSDVRLTLSSFSAARTGSTSYVFTVDEGGEAIVTVGMGTVCLEVLNLTKEVCTILLRTVALTVMFYMRETQVFSTSL